MFVEGTAGMHAVNLPPEHDRYNGGPIATLRACTDRSANRRGPARSRTPSLAILQKVPLDLKAAKASTCTDQRQVSGTFRGKTGLPPRPSPRPPTRPSQLCPRLPPKLFGLQRRPTPRCFRRLLTNKGNRGSRLNFAAACEEVHGDIQISVSRDGGMILLQWSTNVWAFFVGSFLHLEFCLFSGIVLICYRMVVTRWELVAVV